MNNFKKAVFKIAEKESLVFTNPFDYMVVRFKYTKPLNGSDLDIMVYYDNTENAYDKNAVGYNQLPNSVKIPTDATLDVDAYLWWATDDNSSPAGECVEAVVIGINKFNTDETTVGSTINVYLRTGWFGSRGNGNIEVELVTYLGGTMSKVGTDIINTGGTASTPQIINRNVTVVPGQVTEINSNLVGTVIYDKVNKTATLI
jgi:hypothetical protein